MTALIGVEWGLETFRAWRLDERGAVTDRRDGTGGLRKAARRGHEAALLRHVGAWLAPDVTVVLAMSLADRHGWIETPFVSGPADLGTLLGGALQRRLGDSAMIVLPGVAHRAPGANDVMRRETLLALGVAGAGRRTEGGAARQRLLVMPGARTRWVRVVDGRVTAFRTAIGGELLTRLLGGPFGKALPSGEASDDTTFLGGVEQGYRSRHVVSDLFAARAAALLDEGDPALVRFHLSGLMLGNEIREAEVALEATGEALTLIGEEARCGPYGRALRHLGTSVGHESTGSAAVSAFRSLQRSLAPEAPRTSRPSPHATSVAPATPVTPAATQPRLQPRPRTTLRDWSDAFARLPLLAFLPGGDEPRHVVSTAATLVEAGFRILVVSMRDRHAPATIARLSSTFGRHVCIGVRDVPTPKHASVAIRAGARVVIALGTDEALARRCARHDVPWIPGIATVTEAMQAITLGARGLLLYPAEMIEPRVVQSMRRALPAHVPLVPAGGLHPGTLLPFAAAGAGGGVADETLAVSALGRAAGVAMARDFVDAWRRIERSRRRLGTRRRAPSPGDAESVPS